MARIQILELPADVVGEFVKTPFVLIVDRVETDEDGVRTYAETVVVPAQSEISDDQVKRLAEQIGAAGWITTSGTLDVVTP
ncbi:hypothetical protein [Pseudoclavibacter helvolus]|uniref:hypothetical protein n=1 Tax=Pseudoclavibacter helvolus TaxID=255205 RepID=UPI0037359BE0